MTDKTLHCTIAKADDRLGVLFGWAIVCQEGGHDYIDLQGDRIPEQTMAKAALAFAKGTRQVRFNHSSANVGECVFVMPMTSDVQEALGLQSPNLRSGLVVGARVDDETLAKYRSGELTGFSIGGTARKTRRAS